MTPPVLKCFFEGGSVKLVKRGEHPHGKLVSQIQFDKIGQQPGLCFLSQKQAFRPSVRKRKTDCMRWLVLSKTLILDLLSSYRIKENMKTQVFIFWISFPSRMIVSIRDFSFSCMFSPKKASKPFFGFKKSGFLVFGHKRLFHWSRSMEQ